MKKKILVSLGIVFAVIVIAVIVLVASLGTIVNSQKDALLAQAEKRIGREVTVGDVGVAIWPEIGVRVRDVTVSEDPDYGTEPFVRVADLRVNVALMPLFRKRVDVKRFVLNDPVINVIKGNRNRFNFTSLVEKTGGGAAGGEGGAAPSGAAAVPFVLAVADIENGTVHYADPAAGVDRTIRDIDFSAKNVSMDSQISATLAAAVFGEEQDVHVEATVGPLGAVAKPEDLADKALGAKIAMGPVKLSALAAQKPGAPPLDPAQDGTLKVDAALSGTFGAAVFDDISVDLAVLGASEPNVDISATAGPFNLLAESTLVFTGARVKGSASAGPIGMASLPMKPAAAGKPVPKLGGDVSMKASFEGEATALGFDAVLDATRASYELEQQFSKPAGTPAVFELKGTFRPQGLEKEGIEFTSIDASIHALKAHGTGRLVPFKGKESMRFAFDATTAIAPWKDMMPAMALFAPAGDATITLTVTGAPKPGVEPEIKGSASFANVSATLPNVPNPLKDGKGTATFTAKSAQVTDATFSIGKSAFRARADIPSFEPMMATYTVTSNEVWRADVQAPAPNAPKLPRPEVFRAVTVTGKAKDVPGAPKPAPGAPRPLQNDLDIASKSGVASNIDYTDAAATVRATPEKVFIDRFAAKAMGGTVSGSGTMEPLKSSFDVTTKVENVNLAEYFRYKSPALADAFAGKISGDINLSGAGKTWEEIQKTLAGKGGAVVIEGTLLNQNLVRDMFSGIPAEGMSLMGIPVLPPGLEGKMAAKNPKLFSGNTTVFKNLAGSITITDGKLQIPDLKLATADFALTGTGWFGFDKSMNVSTTVTFSEKLTSDLVAQAPAVKYLLSDSGRLDVPVKFSGDVIRPQKSVDWPALLARGQQNLMKEGQQNLDQKVKGLLDNLKKKN